MDVFKEAQDKILDIMDKDKNKAERLLKALGCSTHIDSTGKSKLYESNKSEAYTTNDISALIGIDFKTLVHYNICIIRKSVPPYLMHLGFDDDAGKFYDFSRTTFYFKEFKKNPVLYPSKGFVFTYSEIRILTNNYFDLTLQDNLIKKNDILESVSTYIEK